MSILIKTEGFQALIDTLDKLPSAIPIIMQTPLQIMATQAQQKATDYAPVDTGFLRDNIDIFQDSVTQWRVTSQAGYSYFQEFGFNHYRDGFIPGKFFMTQAAQYAANLLESGDLNQDIADEIEKVIETPTSDG